MSDQQTSEDTRNATFSPALADGRKPSALLSGQQLDLFGPAHAPVNPFRWQGLEKALKIQNQGRARKRNPEKASLFVDPDAV